MGAFIAAALASPIARKIGLYALIAVAIVAAVFGAIKHYEAKGAATEIAKQQAADAAWMKGANENMNKVQEGFASVIQTLNDERQKNVALTAESARLSAANDNRPAFDAGAIGRLQRAGAKSQGTR